MKIVIRRTMFAAALTSLLLLAGAAIWYYSDRAGMLGSLCRAGLPNFSRPAVIDAERLGCHILGPRRRVIGVLLSGFEASNLTRSDLGPAPEGGGFTGSTWWSCAGDRCGAPLKMQMSKPVQGLCDVGLARVVAYGWATQTPGHYGHLGVYAREFFADEVVDVGPPPTDLVVLMRQRWAQSGISDC